VTFFFCGLCRRDLNDPVFRYIDGDAEQTAFAPAQKRAHGINEACVASHLSL
jgi:hypothetical protein